MRDPDDDYIDPHEVSFRNFVRMVKVFCLVVFVGVAGCTVAFGMIAALLVCVGWVFSRIALMGGG